MFDVVYCSQVRMERVKGPVRRAYLPGESQPVVFGVPGRWPSTTRSLPGPSSRARRRSTTQSQLQPAD